ncbi:MAG TPA: cupin domain-containing protein [Polyangiaceae bacterium]
MPSPTAPPSVTPVFDSPPAAAGTERIDVLFEQRGVVIERITSSGTQPTQQFTQPHDEWVLLVRGTATLRIHDQLVQLRGGDAIPIPAHVTHELLATSDNALWIAVHLK